MKKLKKQAEKQTFPCERSIYREPLQRRSFLQFALAGTASIAMVAAGCKKDKNEGPMPNEGVTLDFKDDFGVLNYAYALEQLEAAFYIQVAANPPSAFSAAERSYFQDIQFHEIAHREYFKKALSTASIGSLEVDFSSINFADRTKCPRCSKSI